MLRQSLKSTVPTARVNVLPLKKGQFWDGINPFNGWLGIRVVSVLDSGAEGSGFKSQS